MLIAKNCQKGLKIALMVAIMAAVSGVAMACGGAAKAAAADSHADSVTVRKIPSMTTADSLITECKKLLGTPYHYGSGGPNTFDCSGYTSYIYRKFGYALDHSSAGQARQGRKVEGPWTNLRKGDLVIFTSRHNSDRIGHVGIFIEADSAGKDFTFIHAAVKGGVIISHITEPYYSERYVGARRVLPDSEEATAR